MLLGKELINVFKPDVMILFDCGAGEMMKAALSQRVLCVGIVPNKTHKEMLMVILRKFLEGMNLVNLAEDCPSKPLTMIKFEADHPDNEDVKRSTAPITSQVIRADQVAPSTPKATGLIGGSPQAPRTPSSIQKPSPCPSPLIVPPPTSSAASSSGSTQPPPQPKAASVLAFGTTVL